MSLTEDIPTSEIIAEFEFNGKVILLTQAALEHAREGHGPIEVEKIESCITCPDEIQKSKRDPDGFQVYFKGEDENGEIIIFVTVVRKLKTGNYVWTAYEADHKKNGETIYNKETK